MTIWWVPTKTTIDSVTTSVVVTCMMIFIMGMITAVRFQGWFGNKWSTVISIRDFLRYSKGWDWVQRKGVENTEEYDKLWLSEGSHSSLWREKDVQDEKAMQFWNVVMLLCTKQSPKCLVNHYPLLVYYQVYPVQKEFGQFSWKTKLWSVFHCITSFYQNQNYPFAECRLTNWTSYPAY